MGLIPHAPPWLPAILLRHLHWLSGSSNSISQWQSRRRHVLGKGKITKTSGPRGCRAGVHRTLRCTAGFATEWILVALQTGREQALARSVMACHAPRRQRQQCRIWVRHLCLQSTILLTTCPPPYRCAKHTTTVPSHRGCCLWIAVVTRETTFQRLPPARPYHDGPCSKVNVESVWESCQFSSLSAWHIQVLGR